MEMTDDYRNKIADFISEYFDLADGAKYTDDDVIRQSIGTLITEKVFTIHGLRRHAVKFHQILIPKEFIKECAYYG